MPAQLRVDPLTGTTAAFGHTTNKPRRDVTRQLAPGDPCEFCGLAAQHPQPGGTVSDHGTHRPVLAGNATAFVVPNLYPMFDDAAGAGVRGQTDLAIARRHVTSLEELSDDEAHRFGELLEQRHQLAARRWTAVQTFVNVGLQSGGTVAHLHGQVVAADLPPRTCPTDPTAGTCPVCADVTAADNVDQVITRDDHAVAYVPYAPAWNLELRIAAEHGTDQQGGTLLAATAAVLRAAAASGSSWPYNVIVHHGTHPHVHLLVRVDPGVAYPHLFAVTPVHVDLPHLAATLRHAAARPA